MILYKYQGAGNDFLIADNRKGELSLSVDQIAALCHRRYGIGADGLMLLENADQPGFDFRMTYYNSDGSGGMMCGNGGRCIVAFAYRCGIRSFRFLAADGPHDAEILEDRGNTLWVKLGMKDVDEIKHYATPELQGCFLDTGTRHFVMPVSGIGSWDVNGVGCKLRHHPEFAPQGANVNFIEQKGDTLWVRTFEKGVEDETYACGTGITASAIAMWHAQHPAGPFGTEQKVPIRALNDALEVQFTPTPSGAKSVWLIGPATYVAAIEVE